MSKTLEEQMKLLLEKVDRILSLLEPGAAAARPRITRVRTPKQKAPPLSTEEIARDQERFEKLFVAWDSGEELKVEKELDAMKADEIRRFADANNLNVTSKTPKQKVMRLFAGQFRERRQLMRGHFKSADTK